MDSFLVIRQFMYKYWAGSTNYTSLHAYFVHSLWYSVLTQINFIPSVQNSDTSIISKAYKSVDTMCADVRVNEFYLEPAISRTINWPASMVTHYSPCNNVFHIATCLCNKCNECQIYILILHLVYISRRPSFYSLLHTGRDSVTHYPELSNT